MKSFYVSLVLTICAVSISAAPFRDLGFDEAITNNVRLIQGSGPVSELLPGWQLFFGTNLLSTVGFNGFTTGPNNVTVFDRNSFFEFQPEGRFAFHSKFSGPPLSGQPYSLVQHGEIPTDALFLTYRLGGTPFSVSINDIPALRLDSPIVATPAPINPVFDISMFAGQEVELRLTQTSRINPFGPDFAVSFIDSIAFVVPEPSTWVLLTIGGAGLFWEIRRFRRLR